MIAAKCMYNMAVACEMNDQLEPALEWAVKSYHVFGEKNEVHASNCREYIQILGQRKVDKSFNRFTIGQSQLSGGIIRLLPNGFHPIQTE